MVQENRLKKVIVITGPTAIGKTELSLDIVKKFNGEIINADASQFKKHLNIGTAKINQNETDIIHHFIDIIEPNEDYSIKDFQQKARNKIDEIISRGKIPFIVGGSLLYINSVIYDYDLSNSGRNKENDSKYDNLSNIELYQLLKEKNEYLASSTHPNNRRRVLRYLDLSNDYSKNEVMSFYYDALVISLTTTRPILYKRINKRVDTMIENGFIDEVKALESMNYDLLNIKEIGYSDIFKAIKNELTLNDAIEKIKKDTRHYAKRQMTWIRNKMTSNSVEINYNDPQLTLNEINSLIDDFLKDNDFIINLVNDINANYKKISSSDVVFSEDCLKYCIENKCGKYGKNWMCPPAIGTMQDNKSKCMKYSSCLIILKDYDKEEDKNFSYNDYLEIMKDFQVKTYHIKKELINNGYNVLVLGAGCCTLCEKCNYPSECLNKEKTIPSLEAYGIDCFKTCVNNGLNIVNNNKITFVACVFY